uniref:MAT1 centre domain-containing protein n=1 Tax=Chlamydomonas leiostraca TaxID=1034604 RepID=A0A7S0R2C8_9CHLO|mmetsp:Transcript_12208/g.29748  ORF Transcript_12208/g.29748 Transcript_12208/m.29748 type:complete len:188 (+) Transcript_12208:66-629(+)
MDEIAKELKIRKRIAAIYNKTRDDFETKEAWDDYLEGVEDIIYNLANNVDTQATEARVGDYERANRASIIANQARAAEELRKAQVAEFQASAAAVAAEGAAGAAGTAGAAPPGFTAPTSAIGPALAAQPLPVRPVAQDAHGNLPRAPFRRDTLSCEHAAAKAAGYVPGLPRSRALTEAFSALLLLQP